MSFPEVNPPPPETSGPPFTTPFSPPLSTGLDPGYGLLFKIGAWAALIMVALFFAQLAAYVVWPHPTTVPGLFALFQKSKIQGFVGFDFLVAVDQILEIPIALALFIALRRLNPSLMILFLALSFVGIVCFILARPGFEMLNLSTRYAAAKTEAERGSLLAAGETMFALFTGTGFQVSYVLTSIAQLLMSVVMLGSREFGRLAAWLGIFTAVVGFGLYIPVVGIPLAVLSALALQVFNILIARALFGLARQQSGPDVPRA
ncbi:MAG: hypothetical protein LAN62_14715 [Acidobacteriia bacterium]|nr:hypothetical protein [Terriglobia bacterium]